MLEVKVINRLLDKWKMRLTELWRRLMKWRGAGSSRYHAVVSVVWQVLVWRERRMHKYEEMEKDIKKRTCSSGKYCCQMCLCARVCDDKTKANNIYQTHYCMSITDQQSSAAISATTTGASLFVMYLALSVASWLSTLTMTSDCLELVERPVVWSSSSALRTSHSWICTSSQTHRHSSVELSRTGNFHHHIFYYKSESFWCYTALLEQIAIISALCNSQDTAKMAWTNDISSLHYTARTADI